jgi:DNA-binding FadR family transcriptional regulator
LDQQVPRLHEERIRELLARIAAGEFKPGQSLPREVDLAADLGVSRAVVRTTIQGLADRGVIAVKHGRGQTVRPAEDWNILDVDVLAAVLEAGDRRALLREVFEARALLEVPAAALAAERAGPADLEGMREALDDMAATARARRPRARDGFDDAERRFQARLAGATGNRPLMQSLAPVQEVTRLAAIGRGRHAETVAELERLLEAVAARDREGAREAARAHLDALAAAAARRRAPSRPR